jgi:PadR family transcriptional regulator AphA
MPGRSSTTPYAILGMLHFRPMSGYDIRKEAASSIGHFWSESYGQLYPALRRLAASGLVRRRTSRTGPRDRQVYEITPAGRRALAAWRREAPRSEPVRSELLLKLFFGDRDSPGPEMGWIDAVLARESASLRRFRQIRAILRRQSDHPGLPFWLVTLSYGEHRSRAVVRWCRESKASLRAMDRAGRRRRSR